MDFILSDLQLKLEELVGKPDSAGRSCLRHAEWRHGPLGVGGHGSRSILVSGTASTRWCAWNKSPGNVLICGIEHLKARRAAYRCVREELDEFWKQEGSWADEGGRTGPSHVLCGLVDGEPFAGL